MRPVDCFDAAKAGLLRPLVHSVPGGCNDALALAQVPLEAARRGETVAAVLAGGHFAHVAPPHLARAAMVIGKLACWGPGYRYTVGTGSAVLLGPAPRAGFREIDVPDADRARDWIAAVCWRLAVGSPTPFALFTDDNGLIFSLDFADAFTFVGPRSPHPLCVALGGHLDYVATLTDRWIRGLVNARPALDQYWPADEATRLFTALRDNIADLPGHWRNMCHQALMPSIALLHHEPATAPSFPVPLAADGAPRAKLRRAEPSDSPRATFADTHSPLAAAPFSATTPASPPRPAPSPASPLRPAPSPAAPASPAPAPAKPAPPAPVSAALALADQIFAPPAKPAPAAPVSAALALADQFFAPPAKPAPAAPRASKTSKSPVAARPLPSFTEERPSMVPVETGPVPHFHEPDINAKSNINGVYLGHTVDAMERQLRLAVAAADERSAQAAAALLLGSQNLTRLVFLLARMTVYHRLHASTIVLANNDLAILFAKVNSPAKAKDGHAAWRHFRQDPNWRELIVSLVHAIVTSPPSTETVDATRLYFDAETHPFVAAAPSLDRPDGIATAEDAYLWLRDTAAADLAAAQTPDLRAALRAKLLYVVGGIWLAQRTAPDSVTPTTVIRQLARLGNAHPALAALVDMMDRNNKRAGRRGYRGKLFLAAAAIILANLDAHPIDAAYVENPPPCAFPEDIYRAVMAGHWSFGASSSRKRPIN